MAKRAKPPLPPQVPVTAEFRARCHKLVDDMLDDHPGTEVALFAVDHGRNINAGSVPAALSIKQGLIDMLYGRAHAEDGGSGEDD